MSDQPNPGSGVNPEQPSLNASNLGTLVSIDLLIRQNVDMNTRIQRLEAQQRPLNSFLKASRRVSIISAFALIGTPILVIIAILLYFIILNPSTAISSTIITIFSCLGLVSLAEIVAVPFVINNINNKINRIIDKHYPGEDI